MKYCDVIIDSTIKMMNSKVFEHILNRSGYFDEVEDLSDQLAADNTMAFSIFVKDQSLWNYAGEKGFNNINRTQRTSVDEWSEKIYAYMEMAVNHILRNVQEQFNIFNITSSFSMNDMDGGIEALIYFYFGDNYLS